jgi:hypothetical protein
MHNVNKVTGYVCVLVFSFATIGPRDSRFAAPVFTERQSTFLLLLLLLQVVYETALQLYFLHLLDTQHMQLAPISKRSQALPYTWLSAVLLVSIKLLYGLGSAAAGQLPLLQKAPGPPNGWLAWAQHALQQLPGISSLPLSEQQVKRT